MTDTCNFWYLHLREVNKVRKEKESVNERDRQRERRWKMRRREEERKKKKKLMNKLVSCIFDHKINLFNCKYNIKLGIRWESEWRNEEYENRRWESEREGKREGVEKRRRNIFERDLHLHQTFVQLVDVSGFSLFSTHLIFHYSQFSFLPPLFPFSTHIPFFLPFHLVCEIVEYFEAWTNGGWKRMRKEKFFPQILFMINSLLIPNPLFTFLSLPLPLVFISTSSLILGWWGCGEDELAERERERWGRLRRNLKKKERERERKVMSWDEFQSTRKKSTPECINDGTKTSN